MALYKQESLWAVWVSGRSTTHRPGYELTYSPKAFLVPKGFTMSKLLINEPPLQVLPSLARAVGLNEAIILQQLHYWSGQPGIGKQHEGRQWVRNTVAQWQRNNFPFWSAHTVRNILASLEKADLLLVSNLNQSSYDRSKWYAIDYEKLDSMCQTLTNPLVKEWQMDWSKDDQPIPETTKETTSEKKNPTTEKVVVGASLEKTRKTRSAAGNNNSTVADPPESIALVEDATMRKAQVTSLVASLLRSHLTYEDWTGTDYGTAILYILNKSLKDLHSGTSVYNNEVRYCLELAFRLRCPHLKVPANPKQAGVRWWQPLRELAEAVDWNAHKGVDLLNEAFVRAKGITITAPQSLSSAVQSILVERAATDAYVYVDDFERELEKRYTRNHEYKQYMNLGDKQ